MASCLGIYLSSNIIKYAKLTSDNTGNVKLDAHGVRYVKDNQKLTLKNIIEETNSQNIPIVMNPQNDKFLNYQMFDQVHNKAIANDIAKMEFEAWCEKNAKSPDRYTYVYKVAEVKNEENKFNAVLNFIEKKFVEEYSDIEGYSVTDILPSQFLMYRLVSQDEKNYMLVNLDDKLSISVVMNGELIDLKSYDIGMKQILDDFSAKLGSYQKAYEACKQLNVYSDEETNNDKLLESIAEPVLQEILRNIGAVGRRYKKDLNKIFLSGNGIVFTNIDILVREYMDVKCEILKPEFIQMTNVRNVAEVLETTQAMSLAYEVLKPENKDLEYMKAKVKKKSPNKLFKKKNKPDKISKEKTDDTSKKSYGIDIIEDKSVTIALNFMISLILIVVAYVTFSNVYIYNVNKNLEAIENAKKQVESATSEVKKDINYINVNMNEYKEINEEIDNIKNQIENNQIGKFSTYNVASFLQNIIKVIPRNVQLKTITSDDNKNIKITAVSDSYASLGYFVSELKLKSTLNNVNILNIQNGETTTIEIGGELP